MKDKRTQLLIALVGLVVAAAVFALVVAIGTYLKAAVAPWLGIAFYAAVVLIVVLSLAVIYAENK